MKSFEQAMTDSGFGDSADDESQLEGGQPLPPLEESLPSSPFAIVPLEDIEQATIDPPEFILESLIPRNHVTLMGAHGGAGKSALALAWASHLAAGVNWGGLKVQPARVLFVSLEDGAELLRYRLKKVMECYGLNLESALNLTILDGSQSDGTLAIERSEGGTRRVAMTAAWAELQVLAGEYDLVIIDNASDAFGGDENVRRQVRYFLRELSKLAQANNGAVLLLAHVDKLSAKHGTLANSYSGSTAWHNTARSRLALLTMDEQLQLVHEKCNLGPLIDPIELAWNGPVLMPLARDRVAESLQAESKGTQDADAVFQVMQIAIENGDIVTTATAGSATTFHALEPYPELPKELRTKDGKKRFWAALKKLHRDGRITKSEYRNPVTRKTKERFELAQSAPVEPEKVCADISPHTPLPELAQSGEPCATTDRCANSGTGATGAKCRSCDGEGCDWCKQTGVNP